MENQWIVWYARQQGTKMQASPWWDWKCEVMLLMKKSASKFQVANFGFFSWVVFPPKSRVATFGLLLLGSPTKNLTIVVTVTCQGDNPRYKGKHIPHHYQGAPHGRCRWKVGGVFLDIHLAAFGMVLKWLAFLVARNTWFCAFFFKSTFFGYLWMKFFSGTQFQRCWNWMGLGCWVKQKGGKPGFMKLCRHVGPRLTHFARSGHG